MAAIGLLCAGPIPQDPGYHRFADTRTVFGVPNFWNVASNVPFLLAGMFGLWRLPRLAHPESRAGYLLLCVGVLLVGVGSGYYHRAPSNATLLWDRLPMTVAFMALFALLLGERVLTRGRTPALALLPLLGVAAAVYWSWTEARGVGDLRPYVLVQFLPVLLMPVILLLFPARYLGNRALGAAFGLYVVAKILESLDFPIEHLTGCVSGHTLKHLVAAGAVTCLLLAVPTRRRAGP